MLTSTRVYSSLILMVMDLIVSYIIVLHVRMRVIIIPIKCYVDVYVPILY